MPPTVSGELGAKETVDAARCIGIRGDAKQVLGRIVIQRGSINQADLLLIVEAADGPCFILRSR